MKKSFLRITGELCVGLLGIAIVAFYSNIAVAAGVIILIELNNYSRGK